METASLNLMAVSLESPAATMVDSWDSDVTTSRLQSSEGTGKLGWKHMGTTVNTFPPLTSWIYLVGVVLACFYWRPSVEEIDDDALELGTFTAPLFPEWVFANLLVMGLTRLLFAVIVFDTTISTMIQGIYVIPTYLRSSELFDGEPPTVLYFRGLSTFLLFSQWIWVLLGLSFLALGVIPLMLSRGADHVDSWLLRFALVSFEMAAPNALLMSFGVKFALWPMVLQQKGERGTAMAFQTVNAYLQNNLAVAFIVAEMFFIGRLPIRMQLAPLGMLPGAMYVLLSWMMREHLWRWQVEEIDEDFCDKEAQTTFMGKLRRITLFPYFWLDTTLRATSTLWMVVVTLWLLIFYVAFSLLEESDLLEAIDGSTTRYLIVLTTIFWVFCRFRN